MKDYVCAACNHDGSIADLVDFSCPQCGEELRVKITLEELIDLTNDSNFLRELEAGGIDNWEWYGEAVSAYNENGGDIELGSQ